MNGFDWAARDYLKMRGGYGRVLSIAAFIEPRMPQTGVVLDVGAGPGTISRALDSDSRHMVALDVSMNMMRQTRLIDQPAVAGDACALPFKNEHFDAALLIWSLNHTTDPLLAIKEVTRVARPNASILYIAGVPTHPGWDLSGRALSRLDALRTEVVDHEEDLLKRTLIEQGFSCTHEDHYIARFQQRPHALANKVEARMYGHLRNADSSNWHDIVEPVIRELRSLGGPDTYLPRENQHKFIEFKGSGETQDKRRAIDHNDSVQIDQQPFEGKE